MIGFGQELPINETGEVIYEKILQSEETSKNDLYIRANEWFAKILISVKSVLQMQD